MAAQTRHLVSLARGPARALGRERLALNQKIREVRAASERGLAERRAHQRTIRMVLERAARRGAGPDRERGHAALRRALTALRAHDPERTLERGYALAETADGEPLTSAGAVAAEKRISLRFSDGRIDVKPARGAGERE
jgi:exodeoxyribonuclease VII large subunit